jgi:CBS domain-containing protein
LKNELLPAADDPLARLLTPVEPLSPDETVEGALAHMRHVRLGALPVVAEGRVLGLVGERDLLRALVQQGHAASECATVMQPATAVPALAPATDAYSLLARDGVEVIVGLDGAGDYQGVVTRTRLLDEIRNARRPLPVGGVATLFGVHLTDGHHRGGSGDIALFLTGAWLVVLAVLAWLLTGVALALLSRDPQQALLSLVAVPLTAGGGAPAPRWWELLAPLPVLVALVRLSPLAGLHGAEHQAIHALERGVALEPARVTLMPRTHARCASVYLTLVVALGLLWLTAGGRLPAPLALAALVLLAARRRVGGWLQTYGTTRAPSPQQLNKAVAAAKLLRGRFQRRPERRARRLTRLWNRGWAQIALGAAAAWWAWSGLTQALGGLIIAR